MGSLPGLLIGEGITIRISSDRLSTRGGEGPNGTMQVVARVRSSCPSRSYSRHEGPQTRFVKAVPLDKSETQQSAFATASRG